MEKGLSWTTVGIIFTLIGFGFGIAAILVNAWFVVLAFIALFLVVNMMQTYGRVPALPGERSDKNPSERVKCDGCSTSNND